MKGSLIVLLLLGLVVIGVTGIQVGGRGHWHTGAHLFTWSTKTGEVGKKVSCHGAYNTSFVEEHNP